MRAPPPTPGATGEAGACAALLAAGERLARAVEAELRARHRLGLRALDVLDRLAAAPAGAGVRITGLLAGAQMSQSRMSRLVAELEDRGLVSRAGCAADARGVEVALTDRGLRALEAARRTHHGALRERVLARLEPDEVAALGRIAAKLLQDHGSGEHAPSRTGAAGSDATRRSAAPAGGSPGEREP